MAGQKHIKGQVDGGKPARSAHVQHIGGQLQVAEIEIRKAESALRYGREIECDNAIRNTLSAILAMKAMLPNRRR